jgi:hypothetical protein
VITATIVILAGAVVVLGAQLWRQRRGDAVTQADAGARAGGLRILFPFAGGRLSRRALDAALRLARAEQGVLVPVFLARVPLQLPIDAPLPRQSSVCTVLQEAIEQRAASFGVPVELRVERGRTDRHALRHAIAHERYDAIVISAAVRGGSGFDSDDIAWLLDNADGEIIALRPADEELPLPSGPVPALARRAQTTRRRRDGARRAGERPTAVSRRA